jgi:hypothetical protein
MTKTIKFNTGRKYTADGQIIIATLHDDGVVTFCDHSRQIDGQFELLDLDGFTQAAVMHEYDNYNYQPTTRSMSDGMYQGGCNTMAAKVFAAE